MEYAPDMFLPYKMVACRGRRDGCQTYVRTAFEAWQLDALAPLDDIDRLNLQKYTVPPIRTQRRIAKRIRAAALLKY